MTEIEDGAFRDCSNLSSVNLPTSLKTLGTMAFYDCDLITSVTVPASLEGCGGDGGCGPFGGCDGLKEVSFEAGTTRVADHLLYDCPGIESVAVPEGVTLVESYAFGDYADDCRVPVFQRLLEARRGPDPRHGDRDRGRRVLRVWVDFSGRSAMCDYARFSHIPQLHSVGFSKAS